MRPPAAGEPPDDRAAPVILAVPPSKSVTHRAALLAARADGPGVLLNPLLGADCRATLGALAALGVGVRIDEAPASGPPAVHLRPVAAWARPTHDLDCANSGTTLRLLTAAVATADFTVTLDGDDSLRSRPNGPLLAALRQLGVRVEAEAGRVPLSVCGPMAGGAVALGPRVSSQFASGLALALALGPGGAVTLAPPVDSRPYLDLTVAVAADFGVSLRLDDLPDGGLCLHAPGGQRPQARRYTVEADWSTAAFGLVGGALLGRAVCLTGLRLDSLQGDRAVVDLLGRFGLTLHTGASDEAAHPAPGAPDRAEARHADLHLAAGPLRAAGDLQLGATPDLFPALCALAARAPGVTTLAGAPSLRLKESDRIATMAAALRTLGVFCVERPDGLVVHGRPPGEPWLPAVEEAPTDAGAPTDVEPAPVVLHTAGDHRIYMALGLLVAALEADPTSGVAPGRVWLTHPDCVAVSHSGFAEDLKRLRGF